MVVVIFRNQKITTSSTNRKDNNSTSCIGKVYFMYFDILIIIATLISLYRGGKKKIHQIV